MTKLKVELDQDIRKLDLASDSSLRGLQVASADLRVLKIDSTIRVLQVATDDVFRKLKIEEYAAPLIRGLQSPLQTPLQG